MAERVRQNRENLQASLLDRLIDLEPALSRESVQYRLLSIGQAKAAVIRDLENILNTKRSILLPPSAYQEVGRSLFVYGLSDFSSENPRNPSVRQQLRTDIEKTVSMFEPRLKNVTVRLEAPAANERSLRFRITGLLVVEPVSEPVTFDTYFDANRSEYIIAK
jgi:type VI secretion system protein ImpF